MCAILASGETKFIERAVQKVAGKISRKRSSSLIRSLKPRRQPDDQHPAIAVAERWDGAVEPIWVIHFVGFSKINQARALIAIAVRFGRGAGVLVWQGFTKSREFVVRLRHGLWMSRQPTASQSKARYPTTL